MRVRGASPSRTRSFARYGAVVATAAAALSAAVLAPPGPAAARDRDVADASTELPATAEGPTATPPAQSPAAAPADPSAAFIDLPSPLAPSSLTVARYAFEQGGRIVADLSGHGHTLRTRTSFGGKVRVVRHLPGKALAFPKKCRSGKCPRAVLQAPHAAELNPGTSSFAFGATVRLARRQTSKGQNVLQKGYSARGSQYKLQIDGAAGKPSCVLVDQLRPKIRLVKSTVTVADGQWHRVECRRTGTALIVVVDGIVRGVAVVPGGLSVANTSPLSLGGRGSHQDNDQFQGAVDDVWVSIG